MEKEIKVNGNDDFSLYQVNENQINTVCNKCNHVVNTFDPGANLKTDKEGNRIEPSNLEKCIDHLNLHEQQSKEKPVSNVA